jgi:hypothetical protein
MPAIEIRDFLSRSYPCSLEGVICGTRSRNRRAINSRNWTSSFRLFSRCYLKYSDRCSIASYTVHTCGLYLQRSVNSGRCFELRVVQVTADYVTVRRSSRSCEKHVAARAAPAAAAGAALLCHMHTFTQYKTIDQVQKSPAKCAPKDLISHDTGWRRCAK